MRSVVKIAIISLCITCCSTAELDKEFSCNTESFIGATEKLTDAKKTFSIQLPKHWKTKLFYDNIQSSIYSADTTKQLSETVLIDITQLQKAYRFDALFKKELLANDTLKNLKNKKLQAFQFKNNPGFYAISKGKMGSFSYQVLNIFLQHTKNSSFHLKTEVYGDAEINNRFCKALQTLNTIIINEP